MNAEKSKYVGKIEDCFLFLIYLNMTDYIKNSNSVV